MMQVLLVEDDNNHAHLINRALQKSDVSVALDRVKDGEAAIEYLQEALDLPAKNLPDIILLDLKLPRRDGIEVLAWIKGMPALASTPVIMLTTSNEEHDRFRAYENNVNSYVVKPINFEEFKQFARDLGNYWGQWNQPARPRKKTAADTSADT